MRIGLRGWTLGLVASALAFWAGYAVGAGSSRSRPHSPGDSYGRKPSSSARAEQVERRIEPHELRDDFPSNPSDERESHPDHPPVTQEGHDAFVPFRSAETLEDLLRAAQEACLAADPDPMNRAQTRLIEYLEGDEARALELLQQLKTFQDPSALDLVVGAVAAYPSLRDSELLSEAMLEMASADPEPARRQVALAFLGHATALGAGALEQIELMARHDPEPSVRSVALGALGQASHLHPELAREITGRILRSTEGTADPMLRSIALGSIAPKSLDLDHLPVIDQWLVSDADPAVRLAAAEMLGQTPPAIRSDVLRVLEEACSTEREPSVHRALLVSVVRAGRGDAAASLERLSRRAPALQPEIDSLLAILRSGETDPSEILTRFADDKRAGLSGHPLSTD